MSYLTFAVLVPFSLILTLIGFILAPVLPLLATTQEGWIDNHTKWGPGPRLPKWLSWFQTPDNSLYGDGTFMALHLQNYMSMVLWLWRNPCYAFGLRYLTPPYVATFTGDNTIKDNDGAKEGWCLVHANGLFQFVYVKRIFSTSRCIYVNCGWNIRALVDDNVAVKPNPYQATFVFSPRMSGFR